MGWESDAQWWKPGWFKNSCPPCYQPFGRGFRGDLWCPLYPGSGSDGVFQLQCSGSAGSDCQESGIVFEQVVSPQSGVVSYGFDSYENLKPEEVETASLTGLPIRKPFINQEIWSRAEHLPIRLQLLKTGRLYSLLQRRTGPLWGQVLAWGGI